MLEEQPANRPAPGTAVVADKGSAGHDFEQFPAGGDPGLTLVRPSSACSRSTPPSGTAGRPAPRSNDP